MIPIPAVENDEMAVTTKAANSSQGRPSQGDKTAVKVKAAGRPLRVRPSRRR
jgi:hypothetical protein